MSDSSLPDYFRELRVMVVDDQDYVLSLMRTILYGLKIRNLLLATEALSAYEQIEEFDPNIVFSDWNMEPVDGMQFVRMIRTRNDSPNPHVPIIMVTAHNHIKKIKEARDTGANDFLIKPLTVKAIYSRIRATMEHPRPFVHSDSFFGPDRRRREMGPPDGGPDRRVSKQSVKQIV
jgi:CheY-like chemotaxis protein